MNWQHVEGNWQQFKGKVRAQWGKLTDNDLEMIAGKRDRLIGKLRERYADAKDRHEADVDAFIDGLDADQSRGLKH